LSEQTIATARERLNKIVPREEDVQLDVVVFGSIARREASPESDADFLVVAYELLPEDRVERTHDLLNASYVLLTEELKFKPPGAQGMFGTVISAPDLTERIGLEADTNLTHSQRILLLEESTSIYAPDLHTRLIRALLKRYVIDYVADPKAGVPRFLLNDVERYWRTLCVDYQAKRWIRRDEGWGLRYLKLVISRKLAFVGTITSLLLTERAEVDPLVIQFEMPPLARFAQLHKQLGEEGLQALKESLVIAEEFAAALCDDKFRKKASSIASRGEFDSVPEAEEMRKRGRHLQELLETIFFRDPSLKDRSERYLSF